MELLLEVLEWVGLCWKDFGCGVVGDVVGSGGGGGGGKAGDVVAGGVWDGGVWVWSMVVACKDEVDAVGACGWSGSWGRKRWSACSGHCLSPEQAAVADASNNDSSNTVAIGHPWGVPGRNS